ncbi:hypothetical protein V5799_000050 [Amblyomma americanum]|uniref:Sulfotransferase domain-containing protein n=1 Tax=Amblyomma americanum TaxID=6943 RepID=A0AAQ4D458_AMBAM
MAKKKPFVRLIDGIPRDVHYNAELWRDGLKFIPEKGDLVVLSYPKAGTHWILYIVQLILKRGQPVSSNEEFRENMRYLGAAELKGWTPRLPLRLLQTHLLPRKESISADAKYIYIVRNPWDVAASFFNMVTSMSIYHFQDGSFEEFLDAFLSNDVAGHGNYFDHLVSGHDIKDEPNVFFVCYEDLIEDTQGTILKLARFLGEDYANELQENEQLLQKLLERCAAENMREVMVENFDVISVPGLNDLKENITCKDGYNGDSSKYCLVRKAKVGSWKEYFSPEQLRRMEAAIRRTEEISPAMDLWRSMRGEAVAASGIEHRK